MSFPGGTSVTRLSVYSGQCADGLAGGTPHVHTASTEAYVVIGGAGALHTLDASGFRETPLRAGSAVWFTPGVIHRAVNHGGLDVVAVMSNAGLPEAGDAVMTFPPDILASPSRYASAASLPDDGPDEAVARRRDLAVLGFQGLVAGGPAALEEFYERAAVLVRQKVESWRELYRATAEADARRTAAFLDGLAGGDASHLREATVRESPAPAEAAWGMCGRLRPHDAGPL